MIDQANFGKRLTECMEKAGYNNARLTQELEVSKNAVGNYKNNQIPNAVILYKISQILGTTIEYLLTGKEPESLTKEEKEIIEAYRKADKRTKDIINISLEPFKEQKKTPLSNSEEAG